jgi:hypothetical protein
MRSQDLLRTGLLVGGGVALGLAACGSDDGSKKSPGKDYAGSGEAGVAAGGSSDGEAGEPSASSGADAGSGAARNDAGAAGREPTSADGGSAGTSNAGGAGGESDPGPRSCPTGSADCDDNHDDCETNTESDASNCGRCARVCGAVAACTNGWCGATVLLDPTDNSNWCGGAFSATTAYMITCWGNNDLSEVRSAPLELGASVLGTGIKSYSSEQGNGVVLGALRGILLDGDDVLFGLQENPSHLYKFPVDADGPEDVSVAYTFENATRFDDLKLVGDTFYWNLNTHTAAGQIAPGALKKRAKTGVTSTTLVDGLGLNYNLQIFATTLVWLEKRTANSPLGVYRSPLEGAAVADVELVGEATSNSYMVRHGDYVYWTHKAAAPNGKVRRLLADDASAEPEDMATGLNLPEGLVADDDYAYFKQADALYRVALEGGTAEQLSPVVPAHDAQATAIYHVDDRYVYFAAGSGFGFSTLVRVAK